MNWAIDNYLENGLDEEILKIKLPEGDLFMAGYFGLGEEPSNVDRFNSARNSSRIEFLNDGFFDRYEKIEAKSKNYEIQKFKECNF